MPGTTPASMPSFNSRTHEGCDVNRNRPSKGKGKFQFTHPRGVRHRHMRRAGGEVPVSIHAPTRGATLSQMYHFFKCFVSIHAPTRGATCKLEALREIVEVSIHAPTRGATVLSQDHHLHARVSIHAPTRGATHFFYETLEQCQVSIHAPTRGATSSWASWLRSSSSFNSRTHEGCDQPTVGRG